MSIRAQIFFLGLLAVPAMLGCRRRMAPPPAPPPVAKKPFLPMLEAKGINWLLPDSGGRPLWEIHARKGGGAAANGLAELQEVRCKVYAGGNLAMEADARRVKADYTHKRLLLFGGVAARAVNGKRSFRSERVSLTVKEEKHAVVEAMGSIRMEVDGVVMAGERLLTNPRLSEGRLSAQ